MTSNIYKKYKNMQLIHAVMSIPLSLCAIGFVYLMITIYGYKEHGLAIFGRSWRLEPTLWQETKAFVEFAVGWSGMLLAVIAVSADFLFWPYFYSLDEAKLELETEFAASEVGSGTSSEARHD